MFLTGWVSNRLYAMLGGLRASAQRISYEIRLIFTVLTIMLLQNGFLVTAAGAYPLCAVALPVVMTWLTTILAETNRAPFDFAEGERELVSGFNIEFRRGAFALLFLAEMMSILFMRVLTGLLLFGSMVAGLPVALLFLSTRASYPRFRYDLLMSFFWNMLLPLSICVLTCVCF